MRYHFFVCTNRRAAGGPKPSCAGNDSESVLFALREERERRGLSVDIFITAAGCLGRCPTEGASIVVYPEGVWYSGVTVADVPELVEQHMVSGRVVERLRDSQLR